MKRKFLLTLIIATLSLPAIVLAQPSGSADRPGSTEASPDGLRPAAPGIPSGMPTPGAKTNVAPEITPVPTPGSTPSPTPVPIPTATPTATPAATPAISPSATPLPN